MDRSPSAQIWPALRATGAQHVSTPGDRDDEALHAGLRASGGIARGDDLARLLQDHRCGELVTLAGLIASGDLFGFDHDETFWVPACQFDLRDLSIRSGLHEVIAELSPVFDGRMLAGWFAQPNGWLDGRRPADAIADDAAAVLQAAGVARYIASVPGAAA